MKKIICVILSVVLCIGLCSCNAETNSSENAELQFIYSEKEEKTYLILNGEVLEDTVDSGVSMSDKSWSGTKSLRNDVYFFGGYAVKDKKLYEIADDIGYYDMLFLDIKYSNYGEGAAYVNEDGELMLFRFKTNKSEKVEGDEEIHSFAISPDAKTVLYMTENYELYLYKNGERKKLDDNFGNLATAIAVSNDGEYCYVYDFAHTEGKPLYCYNAEGSRENIFKSDDICAYPVSFNIDNTQVSCYVDRNKEMVVYDSVTGDKTKYINNGQSFDVTPYSEYYNYNAFTYSRGFSSYKIPYYTGTTFSAVEDLNNCFYTGVYNKYSGRFCYIDGGNLEEISENNYYTAISSDNVELFSFDYDNNTLYYLNLEEDDVEETVDEIVGFGVTPDFTHIFYITEDDELYVTNADGSEKKKLDDDVSSENYTSGLNFEGVIIPRVLGNEYIIYGTNDGDTYMCDINGEKTKIKAELDYFDYNFANDYNNTYGRRERSFRTSRLFPSRDFITYVDNGDLYIIDRNGETSLLIENVE